MLPPMMAKKTPLKPTMPQMPPTSTRERPSSSLMMENMGGSDRLGMVTMPKGVSTQSARMTKRQLLLLSGAETRLNTPGPSCPP